LIISSSPPTNTSAYGNKDTANNETTLHNRYESQRPKGTTD
jgi:hypothetical protein